MTKLGKYEILEEIGRGGYAVVYDARDTELNRIVALKVIYGIPADEATFVQRFHQEARTAASLRHPNIVTVYDFGDADGVLYLAMAIIGKGRTLRDLLAEGGPLSSE